MFCELPNLLVVRNLDRFLCKARKVLFIIRNPSQEQRDLETDKLCTFGFCSKLKDEKNDLVDINETRESMKRLRGALGVLLERKLGFSVFNHQT